MIYRLLILSLLFSSSSVFAKGPKVQTWVKLEIGVEACEAYPEDCTRDPWNYYHVVATMRGYELIVETTFTGAVDPKKWTRKLTLDGSDGEAIAIVVTKLARTEIEHKTQMAVCPIATTPAMYVNLLSMKNHRGRLRPVLGPQGCWVSKLIYPKGNLADAVDLKAKLRELVVRTAFTETKSDGELAQSKKFPLEQPLKAF